MDSPTPLTQDHLPLGEFYGVKTYPELVDAMEKHILRLQARLPRLELPILLTPRKG